MKLQAIRMPYFYFDLVIGEEFKDQGGMILKDADIAFDKADCLASELSIVRPKASLQNRRHQLTSRFAIAAALPI